ncbi:MAG TPA: tetratricopeptide repeat protein [Thermoanaerobaculia bacterium]|nr:tetratricopeptide repeat protein [Thermoanaerobaculia bacterium]
MRRSSLAVSLITFLLLSTNAFAGAEARMTGKILDAATKAPIAGASMELNAVSGKTVNKKLNSRKDGQYTLTVLDGTLRYEFTISAPGYVTHKETIKISIGEANHRDFELKKADGGAAAPGAQPAQAQTQAVADPAVAAYNEGANLINGGDVAGAIAKFEAAVAAKPDLIAGWMALAKANVRAKQHDKAIEAAKKALEFDDTDTDMWSVLHQAYSAKGDKANAAIAQKKLPANAAALFNDAVRLINQQKDAEAEVLLKQAVAADAKFARGWYELGMVCARTGKNADAISALNKYLELEPSGSDAATAKEMIGYMK